MWKNSREEDERTSQPKAKTWTGASWRGRKSQVRVLGSLGHMEGWDLAGEVLPCAAGAIWELHPMPELSPKSNRR